jgi:hypothetical protein
LLPRIHYQDMNPKEQRTEIKGKGRRSGTRGQESNQIKENKLGGDEGVREEAKAAAGGVGRCFWSYTACVYIATTEH